MTNLQRGGKPITGTMLRSIWLGLPIAVGGVLAALLAAFALLPQLLAARGDQDRLAQLEQQHQQIALLRAQLQAIRQGVDKAELQQQRLFEIVTGNGDLSTFVAMVDREAGLAGVQLDQFEPQSRPASPGAGGAGAGGAGAEGAGAAKPATPAPPPAAKPPAPPGGAVTPAAADDDLEIRGLSRQSILMSARGPYPALLDFLRRLERLNVLVVQSDLRLLLEPSGGDRRGAEPQGPAQTAANAAPPQPVLKVLLSLYGRPPAAAPPGRPGAAPAAAARPGGAPPAPPGAPPPAPAPPPAAPPTPAPAPAR
jgi:type IV pilus assembly protein PilO